MKLHLVLILLLIPVLQGCSSLGYYWEKISGHSKIINSEQPIKELLKDPNLKPELKAALENTQQARDFASQVLLLPDNDSYRNYADIGRKYVVWTVVATPRYSIKPEEWCFIFVGCVSYRGYFSQEAAIRFAEQLKTQGMDIYVSGNRAYSTLGWFDDPLLSTMLYKSEASRVGIIFHELAHQKLYVENDTAFNEAFATMVEIEGIKRWFERKNNLESYAKYKISKQRDKKFKALLKETQKKLQALYLQPISEPEMLKRKQATFRVLQQRYQLLKKYWAGYSGYDNWMAQDLNNAHLALIATYHKWVPAFQHLLRNSKNDLQIFYTQASILAELKKPQRYKKLVQLLNQTYAKNN